MTRCRVPYKTPFAEHYIADGLIAKHADGGRSAEILNRPLAYLVSAHTGYDRNTDEEWLSRHSPFISFSTDVEAAWHFMDRTERRDLVPCELWEASHFMWRLEGIEAEYVSQGRYRFTYRANPKNVERFPLCQLK